MEAEGGADGLGKVVSFVLAKLEIVAKGDPVLALMLLVGMAAAGVVFYVIARDGGKSLLKWIGEAIQKKALRQLLADAEKKMKETETTVNQLRERSEKLETTLHNEGKDCTDRIAVLSDEVFTLKRDILHMEAAALELRAQRAGIVARARELGLSVRSRERDSEKGLGEYGEGAKRAASERSGAGTGPKKGPPPTL